MKADAYTGFLTSKIKVYGTEKNAKPFEVSGRAIRRAVPLLLASIMSLGSCGQFNKNNSYVSQLSAKEISHDTTSIVKMMLDEGHDYLSAEKIQALLSDSSPQNLTDTNFNHSPENEDNFWEIVKRGIEVTNIVQYSPRLTAEQKAEYKITANKMLSQVALYKGTDTVDLRDFNTMKAFLYFEKVAQYKDKYWRVLGRHDGTIDERSETFGRYYQDQENLKRKVTEYQGVQKFAKALYGCDDRFILHYADSVQANKMSREFLQGWLEEQNINEGNLWYYVDADEYDNCNSLSVYRSRGRAMKVVLGVDPSGKLSGGFYSPVGSTIIHELEHLMQTIPSSKETPEDNHKDGADVNVKRAYYDDYIMELGPTLHSLAIEDQIYKKINGIDENTVVDYGNIDLGTHKVSIGETAVWFHQMVKKYGHKSVDKVLLEPEVLRHLNTLGNDGNVRMSMNLRGRAQ